MLSINIYYLVNFYTFTCIFFVSILYQSSYFSHIELALIAKIKKICNFRCFTFRKLNYELFFSSYKSTIRIRIVDCFHFITFFNSNWEFVWKIFKARFLNLFIFVINSFTIILSEQFSIA